MKYLFPLILLTIMSTMVSAQRAFDLTVELPEHLNPSLLQISYDNGVATEIFDLKSIRDKKLSIAGKFTSSFVAVEFIYPSAVPNRPYYHCFFISDAPARIRFTSDNALTSPFTKYDLTSAFDYVHMGHDKLSRFIANEENDFWDFYDTHRQKMGSNDSLVNVFFQKGDLVKKRKVMFVKEHRDLYYSFWLFRREIVLSENLSVDSLHKIFETFPEALRKSDEGADILLTLRGRNLKKGQIAPLFKKEDVKGTLFSLDQLRGKYVVLNFWATWCAPCIDELPRITRLRALYPKDKLEFVFISRDKEVTERFNNVISAQHMDGIHVISDLNLMKLYGAQSIPKLFFIDDQGVILYNRDEEQDSKELQIFSARVEQYLPKMK